MTILDYARGYVAAGYSVIPVRPDGSKAPAVAHWKEYQSHRPDDRELVLWFGRGVNGIAIICGAVSGNLEVLDFDDAPTFEEWARLVEAEAPGLLDRFPRVATPSGGTHLYCRLPGPPPGNRKLALAEDGRVLIETRGEGGYVLAPGCPPACHPQDGGYFPSGGPALT